MGEHHVDSLGAGEGLHLAHVSVRDAVSAADRDPVPQASLVANLRRRNDRLGDAGTLERDGHARSPQASEAVQLTGVSVRLSVCAAHGRVVARTGDVALWARLNTSTGVTDPNLGLLHAGEGDKLTLVAVRFTVRSTQRVVIHRTCHLALLSRCHRGEKKDCCEDHFCAVCRQFVARGELQQ